MAHAPEPGAPVKKRGAPTLGGRLQFGPSETHDIRGMFARSSDEAAPSPNPRPSKRSAAENETIAAMMRNIKSIFPGLSDAVLEAKLCACHYNEELTVAALLESQSSAEINARTCQHGNHDDCAECEALSARVAAAREASAAPPAAPPASSMVMDPQFRDFDLGLGVGAASPAGSSAPLGLILSWATEFVAHVTTPLNAFLRFVDVFFQEERSPRATVDARPGRPAATAAGGFRRVARGS